MAGAVGVGATATGCAGAAGWGGLRAAEVDAEDWGPLPGVDAREASKAARSWSFRSRERPWALLVEELGMSGTRCVGMAVDIATLFDQAPRELVVQLARMGGMPKGTDRTCWEFHNKLKVWNSIEGALGVPYMKEASILKGGSTIYDGRGDGDEAFGRNGRGEKGWSHVYMLTMSYC